MPEVQLKVLQIIPNLDRGGAERLTLDICMELSGREHVQVKLVTLGPDDQFGEISGMVDKTVISSSVQLSLLRANRIDIGDFLAIVEAFRPDIIHSHLYLAELVSREVLLPGIRYFTHFHDNMPVFARPALRELFSKAGIARIYERQRMINKYSACQNSIICISGDTMHYAKRSLGPEFRYQLLYNAINFDRFYDQPFRQFTDKPVIRLLNTGSFVPKKNQVFLLGVVQALLAAGYVPRLVLLGDGPERAGLQRQVNELGLEEHITFPGIVHDVERYISQSDLYVHSATYEPFGLALLEAMAGGLPVVSIDGGGNRDIVLDGVNGYLLPEQDVALFAGKIISLAADGESYERMSGEAVNFAKGYDIKIYVDKLLDIYRSAE
jgi:glycosyltransferase involved in cell wall biosynthesis